MKKMHFLTTLVIASSLTLLLAAQGCHSNYNEGSEEGNYDTVQTRTDDRTMSKQQHDGVEQPNPDTVATVDSAAMQ